INLEGGEKLELSALAYDAVNQPIWNSIQYNWGMSSNNSVGSLMFGNLETKREALFYAINPGEGDLWVTASDSFGNSATKSLRVTISEKAETDVQKADINQDGIVNVFDFLILSNNFLKTNPDNPRADMNKDGIVNVFDFVILSNNFLKTT